MNSPEHVSDNGSLLVRKAFEFRRYPDKEQQATLAVQLGHTCFINNHYLRVRGDHYQKTGESLTYQGI